MKMKIYSLLLAMSLIIVSSCDLDLLDDPNVPSISTANPNFIATNIQVDFARFFESSGTHGMRLTRMINQNQDNYQSAYVAVTFNPIWARAYQDIMNDVKLLEQLAEDGDINYDYHLGIARTIRSYVLMTLTDVFGEVPWSEALDPLTTRSPKVDSGEDVYAAAMVSLQQAKANFSGRRPAALPLDLFYANDASKWLKLINSMELKYYLNRRLIDPAGSRTAINSLIEADNFIGVGDDFVFRYGVSLNDPDSRHPRFAGTYTAGGGDYQSTWYMYNLMEEGPKPFDDPRLRYYLYRQVTTNPTDPDKLRCLGEIAPGHYLAGSFPFCLPGKRGYWGRDHLNNEGIPPDGLERTVWGLYPAGGRYDNDSGTPVNNPSLGNQGSGVQPIILSSFVDFMLAEAVQEGGVNGDAKELLISAVGKHMNYVRAFAENSNESGVVDSFDPKAEFQEKVADYLTYIEDEFDNSTTPMMVIGREYWLSLYGNGIEAYNLHRRTGQPSGMQPGLLVDTGDFPRSYLYPNDYMVTNINAKQRAFTDRVFWDNNPAGFIY